MICTGLGLCQLTPSDSAIKDDQWDSLDQPKPICQKRLKKAVESDSESDKPIVIDGPSSRLQQHDGPLRIGL